MKIIEIGTGYTSIPAKMGAATEIVVEELTKAFIKTEKDVSIIDLAASDRGQTDLPIIEVSLPERLCRTDVSLGVIHKVKRVLYSIKLAGVLKKIIKKSNERIVLHFHNQYNMYFFLKLNSKSIRRKCILAYTNHSYIWHGRWEEIQGTIKKRYFQEVYSMRNADFVYVLNQNTAETLVKHVGVSSDRVVLIDNGVNTDVYHPLSEAEKEKAKKEMKLSGKKVFIQVGSVCDRKNQLESIRLLTDLMKNDNTCVFLYAGGIISDVYKSKIDDYASKNGISGQVCYLGELVPGKQLNDIYNIAEAMVFPSKSEGFSLVIIEAMAAGTPVIINAALQFKLSNECLKFTSDAEFKNIIDMFILEQSKKEEISERIRKSVVEKYSWNKVASDYYVSWEGKI